MKNLSKLMCGMALLLGSCSAPVENDGTITITGKVKFPDNAYKMQIIQRNGFDKKIIDSCEVKPDGTYEFKMKVEEPGVYSLNCQKWQSVDFWAEDENLEINFRGQDTAKIKIKNPPYVYIKGGKNNELMNLLNYDGYRGYQLMIAVSQNVYGIEALDNKAKMETSMKFYDMLGQESGARMEYLAEHYADRHSVLAVLGQMRGAKYDEIVNKTLAEMEAKCPGYAPMVKFKTARAEAKALKERMEIGHVAPDFSLPTPDGKKNLGPKDFRGKFLVIDFWASWCGPCRNEIPVVKKAYDKYHAKGVEFLSVSIDKNDKKWREAMEEEKMPWAQVLAPEAGKGVMKSYQFSGIPFIILLDQEGKIVGKQLRGDALLQKIDDAVNGKLKPEVKKETVVMGAMSM